MATVEAQSGEEWSQVSASHFVPVRVQAVSRGFRGRLDATDLGQGLGIAAVDAGACRLRRDPGLIRTADAGDVVLLSIQRFGPFRVAQREREVRLTAGEAVLYRASEPFSLVCEARTACVSLRVPGSALAASPRALQELTARAIPADAPGMRVLAAFAEEFASSERSTQVTGAAGAGVLASGLVNMLVDSLLEGRERLGSDGLVLAEAMRRFVDDNVTDPAMTPDVVAARFRVSTRYVAAVFRRAELPPPAAYIRARRLGRAVTLLGTTRLPVAEIGFRVGFSDPATFARALKRHTGRTASEIRHTAGEGFRNRHEALPKSPDAPP